MELWTFPGGRSTPLNSVPLSLEAVARREVLEETGVPIEAGLRYVCSASFRAQDGHPVINIVFAATTTNASPTTPQASEVSFAKWLPLREVLSHPDLPLCGSVYPSSVS